MSYDIGHWIQGSATQAADARFQPLYNPATGAVQGRVLLGTPAELDAAVASANAAQRGWGETRRWRAPRAVPVPAAGAGAQGAARRSYRARARQDPARRARRSGPGHREHRVRHRHAPAAQGEYTEQVARGLDAWSLRQPLGVVAGITPFNFPAMVPFWMFPLAIGCGNAFILKPSERDPRLRCCWRNGCKTPGCRTASSTSCRATRTSSMPSWLTPASRPSASWARRRWPSTSTKWAQRTASASGPGRAKNHLIVMPDADLDGAVDALLGAAMARRANAAWRSRSPWRWATWATAWSNGSRPAKVAALRVGEGHGAGVEMGPPVTQAAAARGAADWRRRGPRRARGGRWTRLPRAGL